MLQRQKKFCPYYYFFKKLLLAVDWINESLRQQDPIFPLLYREPSIQYFDVTPLEPSVIVSSSPSGESEEDQTYLSSL